MVPGNPQFGVWLFGWFKCGGLPHPLISVVRCACRFGAFDITTRFIYQNMTVSLNGTSYRYAGYFKVTQ